MGAPESSGKRIASECAVSGARDGIQGIRNAVFSDEAAAPRSPVGKLAYLRPLVGDGGMFHLPQVIADHVVENAQHNADPADIVAEQCRQCRISRRPFATRRLHRPSLTQEKPACRPRWPKDRRPCPQARFGSRTGLVGKILGCPLFNALPSGDGIAGGNASACFRVRQGCRCKACPGSQQNGNLRLPLREPRREGRQAKRRHAGTACSGRADCQKPQRNGQKKTGRKRFRFRPVTTVSRRSMPLSRREAAHPRPGDGKLADLPKAAGRAAFGGCASNLWTCPNERKVTDRQRSVAWMRTVGAGHFLAHRHPNHRVCRSDAAPRRERPPGTPCRAHSRGTHTTRTPRVFDGE